MMFKTVVLPCFHSVKGNRNDASVSIESCALNKIHSVTEILSDPITTIIVVH